MAMLLRLLGVYTVLVAVLVAANFVFAIAPELWDTLDWFMAGGAIIAMGGAISCKRSMEADAEAGQDVRRFLDVNVPFYAAAALLIAFAFQWFAELNSHEQIAGSILWVYINPAYITITGMMGVRIWKAAGRM